jgi:integrase
MENIKEQLGNKWLDSKKVFTSDEGGPIHPDVPRKIFRRVLEKYKLPIIRFHDLRHTSASLQLSSGANIADISRRLGHSDISTTLNIYSHSFNSGNQIIVNQFNKMFNTKEG